MRQFIERLLQTVDPPDPVRAEHLWAEYRTGGPKADTAFATLMAWYGGPIYRRIWGFVRSDAAEDVFQDVLVRLHRRRQRFADFDHALRWLRGVAMTQSLNARRGNARRTKREQARAAGGVTTSEVEAAELADALRAALAKLPEREREAVALVYFEGMTRQDGAAALGVHRDTIAKLLETAVGRLKTALTATAVGAAVTTAGVETALAVNPGLSVARLSVLADAAWVNARGSAIAWPPARRLVPLILAGGLVAAAVAATFSWSRFMARTPNQPARLQLTQLESREVPSADFVSALGVGNETGATWAHDIATDAAGNSYVTGAFSGTTDFDPANDRLGGADVLTARGTTDAFVAKYAPDSSLVWVRRMGGETIDPPTAIPSIDVGQEVAVDAAGNVYVTGSFVGPADFGPTVLTTAGDKDGFVAKLAADGSFLWTNRWGVVNTGPVTQGDSGFGVGTDPSGNVYALIARDNGDAPSRGYDVVKYSPDGVVRWSRAINTNTRPMSGDLAVTAGGSVVIGGVFAGTVDFDPGPRTRYYSSGPTSTSTGFALSLSSAGNFNWAAPFVAVSSGNTYFWVFSVAVDSSGNVLVGGTYKGSVDFDPGSGATALPPAGGAVITKLTSGGAFAWARSMSGDTANGPGTGVVYGLAADAAGNVYATGHFFGTVDFDPGVGTAIRRSARNEANTADSADAFAMKLSAAGAYQWADTFGGAGVDRGFGIAVDPSGLVHLAGTFQETVDFDPDPNSAFDLTTPGPFGNFFLVRLRSN